MGGEEVEHGERRRRMQSDPVTRNRARELRASMSKPEVLLWTRLRRKQTGFLFRRQRPLGPYIADFYCHEALLVVEIDGASHEFRGTHDRRRDVFMADAGIVTLRLPAARVLGALDEAVDLIWRTCRRRVDTLAGPRRASATTSRVRHPERSEPRE
ncbi:MAG: endonuclease domain-containing protein [Phycisphaerales bacterium JB054]